MKKILALLVVTAATLFAVPSTATAAPTKNPGCITKAEFRKIKSSQSEAQVRAIVGSAGKITEEYEFGDGDAARTREFKQCGQRLRLVSVSFGLTPYDVTVSDVECYEDGNCTGFSYTETRYRAPYIVHSKFAYWQ